MKKGANVDMSQKYYIISQEIMEKLAEDNFQKMGYITVSDGKLFGYSYVEEKTYARIFVPFDFRD